MDNTNITFRLFENWISRLYHLYFADASQLHKFIAIIWPRFTLWTVSDYFCDLACELDRDWLLYWRFGSFKGLLWLHNELFSLAPMRYTVILYENVFYRSNEYIRRFPNWWHSDNIVFINVFEELEKLEEWVSIHPSLLQLSTEIEECDPARQLDFCRFILNSDTKKNL